VPPKAFLLSNCPLKRFTQFLSARSDRIEVFYGREGGGEMETESKRGTRREKDSNLKAAVTILYTVSADF
jgi:hypothetical protein